jgi:hypothetical protein
VGNGFDFERFDRHPPEVPNPPGLELEAGMSFGEVRLLTKGFFRIALRRFWCLWVGHKPRWWYWSEGDPPYYEIGCERCYALWGLLRETGERRQE